MLLFKRGAILKGTPTDAIRPILTTAILIESDMFIFAKQNWVTLLLNLFNQKMCLENPLVFHRVSTRNSKLNSITFQLLSITSSNRIQAPLICLLAQLYRVVTVF